MRSVLMVLDSLDVGGAERHAIGLSALLIERGYDVRVACSVGGPLEGEAAELRVPVRALGATLVKRQVSAEFAALIGDELTRGPWT